MIFCLEKFLLKKNSRHHQKYPNNSVRDERILFSNYFEPNLMKKKTKKNSTGKTGFGFARVEKLIEKIMKKVLPLCNRHKFRI